MIEKAVNDIQLTLQARLDLRQRTQRGKARVLVHTYQALQKPFVCSS